MPDGINGMQQAVPVGIVGDFPEHNAAQPLIDDILRLDGNGALVVIGNK